MRKKRTPNKYIDTKPRFIVVDDLDNVYIGLIRGRAVFSPDIEKAKPLQGQTKFNTLKRFTQMKLSQIFL